MHNPRSTAFLLLSILYEPTNSPILARSCRGEQEKRDRKGGGEEYKMINKHSPFVRCKVFFFYFYFFLFHYSEQNSLQ